MSDEANNNIQKLKGSKIFIPKVPIKKESVQSSNTIELNASIIKETETNNSTQIKNKKNHIRTKYNNYNNRQDDHKTKIKDLENKARHWTMPSTGAGFFFGSTNNSNKLTTKTKGFNTADINTGIKLLSPKTDNTAVKISRPNENIHSIVESNLNKIDYTSNHNYHSLINSNIVDTDSDIDVNESEENSTYNIDNNTSMEIWPPISYDPQAPLALPLGPKSESLRNLFTNEPILSDPNDFQGIEREESHGLFVIQMPSDLKFDTLQIDNNNILNQSIGKLQLMKSGKVRLVTKTGKMFEVSAGMNSSFAQILSGVEINSELEISTNIPLNYAYENKNTIIKQESLNNNDNQMNINLNEKQNSHNNNNTTNKQINSLNLLGSITKKLVITPSYDIGERKSRAFSMSANSQTVDNNKSNISYRLRSPDIGTSTEVLNHTTLGIVGNSNNSHMNVSNDIHNYNQEEIVYMETDMDETFI